MARTSQEYVMFNCENVKLKLFQLEHQLASFIHVEVESKSIQFNG